MHSEARIYVIVGAVLWLGLFLINLPFIGDLAAVARLFLFAVLIMAPLPIALVASADERFNAWPLRAARAVNGPAALLAVGAMLLPPGYVAAALAFPWLVFTVFVGLGGLGCLLAYRLTSIPELCIAAGLLYLPVGGVWFALSRSGANPLGFGDTIVLLTAVHFHFAGYAVPILAGRTGRWLLANAPSALRLFRPIAAGLIAGMALVAAGITVTAWTGSLVLEAVAVVVLAGSVLGFALIVLIRVVPFVPNLISRLLLLISALSPLVAMLIALAYAFGRLTAVWQISIEQMIEWHGWLNALGFVLCGLLGWLIWKPAARV